MVDLLVVGCRKRKRGVVEVALPVGARDVLDAAFVTKPDQVGTERGGDDPNLCARAQQQRDLAGRDLAAADDDTQLVRQGQEYR